MTKAPKQVPYRKPVNKESRVFTLKMLQIRWKCAFEEMMRLLQKHKPKIFGLGVKVSYEKTVDEDNVMVYEEDVLKIEKKDKLPHKKLKPKKIILPEMRPQTT